MAEITEEEWLRGYKTRGVRRIVRNEARQFISNLIRVEQGTSSNSGSSVKDTRTVSPLKTGSKSIKLKANIGILLECSKYDWPHNRDHIRF